MQDLLIIQSLVSLQVIYKKFQVKCPFAEFSHNNTVTSVNTSVAANAGGVQMTPGGDPACIPRLFNLNSQVYHRVTEIMLRVMWYKTLSQIKWQTL